VSVVPVLLGTGVPLFGGEPHEQKLELKDSRSFPTGLVQLSYLIEH
jgi:hypothetical protein